MPERPNLLVFMSDQHSGRVMGCAGDPFVRTPNLDALARRGVRFDRTYCGNPLCVPSRMTFLTARCGSEIDVWSNRTILRSEIPTFAHSLGLAGYETVLCGRMHFSGADHRHGFEKALVGDVTPQWPGTTGPDLGNIPLSTTGQSRAAVMTAGPGRTGYQAFDRAVTDGAIEYLRDFAASGRERPFCLVVGGVLPHCPFICPKDLFEEYYDKVDVPRLSEAERAGLHPAMLKWREARGVDDIPDDVVRTARAAYYGLVTLLDGLLGELFDSLAETGLAEDTAVFYTSDHGDMAGLHEMWWKSSFYEDSVGVPLIASWPGHFAEGRTVETPVSLLDLGATLPDLGGGEPLPASNGRSLTGYLDRDGVTAEGWDVYSECYGNPRGEGPSRMIVRWPWKLVHYHGEDRPALFNLEEDPHETRDLGADPACADVRGTLHRAVLVGWDGESVLRSLDEQRVRYNWLTAWSRAAHPADPDHWVEPEGCNVFPET